MQNILVVFTGGTIGSSVNAHTIDTAAENRYRLLDRYAGAYARASEIRFSQLAPVELLSENLTLSVWETLLTALDAAIAKDHVHGIIVTHGTDTLAFTASAMAVYLRNIRMPIMLVSSDYPLTDPRANGLENFNAAVEFICQRGEAGVFVAYRNARQNMHIHHGHRLASCLQLSSDFISVQHQPYLEYSGNKFTLLGPAAKMLAENKDLWPLRPLFSKNVLLLKPYPGLNYGHICLDGITAVLHDLYHSGTACVTGQGGNEYALLAFMQRCAAQEVKVYFAPAVKTPDSYASTQILQTQGGVFIWDTSLETAYVQLLLGYGNFHAADSRARFLQTLFTSDIG